jgi:energy-coupling factor transport system ATP-binding protein
MITILNIRYHSISIDTLTIPPGITSVIGPNGSGKTTLLKLCAGIAMPDTGQIQIDGVSPRETEMGWVNEFPDKNILFPRVSDEIASALRFCHTPCSNTSDAVHRIAKTLNIDHLLSREMREISGGEKVLVALAAALVTSPKLLVLDEYDSHIDASHCDHIEILIRESGATYVIRCTQQMETAAYSDHLIFIEQGLVKYTGTPETVFTFLSGTPFYPLSWRCRG